MGAMARGRPEESLAVGGIPVEAVRVAESDVIVGECTRTRVVYR